ncbi:MAG: endonuclease III domain-containing protein [Thermoplasmatota archaeon]
MLLHTRLYLHFGDPGWWPGGTPFEIAVGAVLTQNTAWRNVERAIENLSSDGLLDPAAMDSAQLGRIASLIRPSGYHNQKAGYLKELARFTVGELNGDISSLSGASVRCERERLLALRGIGEETADSIMCYAASRPVLVVDAYTRRILSRIAGGAFGAVFDGEHHSYHRIQNMVMKALRGDHLLYNRFHALIVLLAKGHCKKKPSCRGCPVSDICGTGSSEHERIKMEK